MKSGLTEVVFLLDCSGSMYGLEKDTIDGFNTMLKEQKCCREEYVLSTVLFNHEKKILHDRVNIHNIEELTTDDYYVSGSTALLDTLGDTILHIQNNHQSIRNEDVPERTMFVITTDGMENASRRFSYNNIMDMVSRQKTECGWDFLFLGANIDAISTAQDIGIDADHAASFINDSCGIATNYTAVSEAIREYRSRTPLKASWKMKIDGDFEQRKEV